MKNVTLIATLFVTIALLPAFTGCAHKPVAPTPIPNMSQRPAPTPTPGPQGPGPGEIVTPTPQPQVSTEPTPLDYGKFAGLFAGPHNEDRDKFKADTIHFDFDSSTIKPSEEPMLQDLANYFKNNDRFEGLVIEGNCDERGTEKYNLSLGERRALAAREYLGNLGVNVERIKTVTYGKSRPVDPGHNEAAWKQNRRDEFVLVTQK
jgi:peptidoglycan-associated lipoprotein